MQLISSPLFHHQATIAPAQPAYQQQPAYQPPAYGQPGYPPPAQPPAYEQPGYPPPAQPAYQQSAYWSTQQAAYQQSAYQQPAYQQPAYQQAAYQQPAYQQSAYQQPAYQQAAYQQSAYQQPAYQQPAYQPPAYQPPASQPPAYQQSAYWSTQQQMPYSPASAYPSSPPSYVPTPPAPVSMAPPQPGLIPFQVNFKGVTEKQQATKILDEVARLHAQGARTVGITYSANQTQTENIIGTYNRGHWETNTTGENQAKVILNIEALLKTPKYAYLQNVYRTVPITTMRLSSTGVSPIDDASVQNSLINADRFIANGGVLLGWRNELTLPGQLAIGGGVSDKVQTAAQKQMINHWVQRHSASPQVLAQPTAAPPPPFVVPPPLAAHQTSNPVWTGPAASTKWAEFRENQKESKPGCLQQSVPNPSYAQLSSHAIEQSLKQGVVPLLTRGVTALDRHIMDFNSQDKDRVAELLVKYLVKNVMGHLGTDVTVSMVDNPAAKFPSQDKTSPSQDKTSMRIQFRSQEEAMAFSQKLLAEHGIHSASLGAGAIKKPQNGAIYLTQEDLHKISANCALTEMPNTAATAYQVMATTFQQSKPYTPDDDPTDLYGHEIKPSSY